MNLKFGILLFLCLVFNVIGHSQQSDSAYIDSLLRILPSQSDSNKTHIYYDLGDRSRFISLNQSSEYFRKSAFLSKDIDRSHHWLSIKAIGINHLYAGQNDSSLYYLQKALDGYIENGDNDRLASTKETIGVVYQRNNEPEKALEIYQEIMREVDGTEDWLSAVGARVNAIGVMINQKNYIATLPYIEQAEEIIQEKSRDSQNEEDILFFRPQLFINAGLTNMHLKKYEQAESYFLRAIDDAFQQQNDGILAYCYNSLGEMTMDIVEDIDEVSEKAHRRNTLSKALGYFEKAELSFLNVNDMQGLAFTKINMGSALKSLERYFDAMEKLESGAEIVQSIDNPKMQRDYYKQMHELSAAQKDSSKAYVYMLKYNNWKDSIFTETREELLQEMDAKYQTAVKEGEINTLTQQTKLQRYLFIFAVVGILGLGSILWNRYQLRKRKEEAEKERQINNAMSAFVPTSFIKMLGRDNILDVHLGDQVEKDVTVVFTDIRSFTSISEQMSPLENFDFVRKYAARMGPPIQRNNGFVNQYMGDGIMAIFERSPEDALQACIEMFHALKAFNTEKHINHDIRVGMGMHTGSLVMGIIGDDNRKDAATISDTVNTASRIESVTKAFGAELLVSQDTFDQIGPDKFNFRALGHVMVHGKSLPIKIYQCLDHYSPEITALRMSTIDLFKKGVSLFFNRSYEASKEVFEKIIEIDPEDNVSRSFISRASNHMKSSVKVN